MVTKIVIQIKIMIVVLTIITIGATKIIGVTIGLMIVTAGATGATAGAIDAIKIIGASVEPYVFHA